jgi:hypothetical protein
MSVALRERRGFVVEPPPHVWYPAAVGPSGGLTVRKLFFIITLCLLALSCGKPQETGMGGGTPGKAGSDPVSVDRQEMSSCRKLAREWHDRYSEKTMRRRYGLSKKQFESVKKELRKQDPSLTTKATQNPPNSQTSPTGI